MPILKHAKKKLRQDTKRERERRKIKALYKAMLKKARTTPSKDSVSAAFKAIDKAAKINVIHVNKAARLKSSLAKVTSGTPATQAPAPKKRLTKAARAKANKASSSVTAAKAAETKAPVKKKAAVKKK